MSTGWCGTISARGLLPWRSSPSARTTYDLDAEGVFPPFLLEVVSPSRTVRDQEENQRVYECRVRGLFTPRAGAPSTLEGYRRGTSGAFEVWPRDEQGRLPLTPAQQAEERRRAEEDVRRSR